MYKRPSNDPLYLERSEAEHYEDMYRVLFERFDALIVTHEQETDADEKLALFKRAKDLGKVLKFSERDIYAKFGRLGELDALRWEDELAAGNMPTGLAKLLSSLPRRKMKR